MTDLDIAQLEASLDDYIKTHPVRGAPGLKRFANIINKLHLNGYGATSTVRYLRENANVIVSESAIRKFLAVHGAKAGAAPKTVAEPAPVSPTPAPVVAAQPINVAATPARNYHATASRSASDIEATLM